MDVRLFKFDNGNHREYIIAPNGFTKNEAQNYFYFTDHGGTPVEVFADTIANGNFSEVTSLCDVPEDERNWIPHVSDYLDMDDWECEILDFFAYKSHEMTGQWQ